MSYIRATEMYYKITELVGEDCYAVMKTILIRLYHRVEGIERVRR